MPAAEKQGLRIEVLDGVVILTLCDPASRNALSRARIAALRAALDQCRDDARIRAVIIAAEGPAFSAGHDLKEITARRADADKGRAFFAALMAECSAMMLAITHLPKPVIAAIEGLATAAGCQLAATADIVIAGEEARFQTPGVIIGLFCSTPMVALSRAVGRKAAMEMLLTGDPISASRAAEIGLASRVVPKGRALEEAKALARSIAGRSARILAIGKRAFYDQAEMPLTEAYAHTSAVMTQNLLDAASCEGISAFLEKRAPQWPQED